MTVEITDLPATKPLPTGLHQWERKRVAKKCWYVLLYLMIATMDRRKPVLVINRSVDSWEAARREIILALRFPD